MGLKEMEDMLGVINKISAKKVMDILIIDYDDAITGESFNHVVASLLENLNILKFISDTQIWIKEINPNYVLKMITKKTSTYDEAKVSELMDLISKNVNSQKNIENILNMFEIVYIAK